MNFCKICIHRLLIHFLLYIFFLLATNHSIAASYPSLKFQIPQIDGKKNNEAANAALIDRKGFLWFTTDNGLVRYDGYSSKRFKNEPNNRYSISSNNTTAILEDKSGNLWIGTQDSALNQFNPETELFTRFLTEELSNTVIHHLFEDSQGYLWISTFGKGLIQFNPNNGDFIQYMPDSKDKNSLSFEVTWKVIEDPLGNLWIATSDGLDYFEREKKFFIHYKNQSDNPFSLSHRFVYDLFYDSQGILWVATNNGLNRWEPTKKTFRHYYPDFENRQRRDDDNIIEAIHEDQFGNFWVGTNEGGLKLFDRDSGKFTSYVHNQNIVTSIRDNKIERLGLVEDRSGNLWILTRAGLNKLNLFSKSVKNYQNSKAEPDSLSGNVIWAIHEDPKGQLWMGTNNSGLNLYDEKNKGFNHFRSNASDPNSISSDRVFSLLVDNDETLWVGTDQGLDRRDKDQSGFTHYTFNPEKLRETSQDRIFALLEYTSGEIWIATTNGLRRFNKENNIFTHYFKDVNVEGSISDNWLTRLYKDRENRLWIGSTEGLNLYKPETDSFESFKHEPDVKESLISNSIYSIYQTKDGYLWVGTDNGLDKILLKNESIVSITHYQDSDGLPGNKIFGVLEDDEGFLWIATSEALTRFDPVNEVFSNFYPEDGFQDRGYNTWAYLKRGNGEMLFGGPDGFDWFNPLDIEVQSTVNKVELTDFLVFNKRVSVRPYNGAKVKHSSDLVDDYTLEQSITYSQEIILTHQQTMFAIEFSSLNFLASDKVQHAYQLQGIDSEWVYSSASNRLATYTNIPAGQYLFRVKSTDAHGIWQEDKARELKITILPPIWLTWWAKSIYVLLFISSFVFLYHLRTSRLRKRTSELEATVKIRTKELADEKKMVERLLAQKTEEFINISHEFRTPLTLIIGPVKQLLENKIDGLTRASLGDVIQRNCHRLLRMVDQLLQMERFRLSQSISRSPQQIKPIIQYIVRSFQPLAIDKKIHLALVQVDDVYSVLSNDALEKMVLNLLSNAIKYTPEGGMIEVKVVSAGEQWVEITVKDSGLGIANDQLEKIFGRFHRVTDEHSENITGSGIGLALVKQLVDAHEGTIEVKSQVGLGSTFIIRLPQYHPKTSHLKSIGSNIKVNQEFIEFEIASVAGQHRSHNSSNENLIAEKQKSELTGEHKLPKLLIIEDNPDLRQYMESILSTKYHCILAKDGKEGFQIAINEIPELIISDIMMPFMDGYQVCKKLKADQRTSHIPIILLTAKNDKDSRIRGWVEKADDYITKPFDSEELILRVSNLLENRRLLFQQFQLQLRHGENHATPNISSLDDSLIDKDATNSENKEAQWLLAEKQFIERFDKFLNENITDTELRVGTIAEGLYMSERQLSRKLSALLGSSPADYLRNYRIEKACKFLEQGYSIKQVLQLVGFTSPSNFGRIFKLKMGISPAEYAKQNKKKTV